FLLAYFLTEPECCHLEGFASKVPYGARRDGTTHHFEGELRRLRSLGFIQGLPGHGIGSLLKALDAAGGQEVNVKDYFEITPRGRDYLRLRAEVPSVAKGSV
ncbi:MAG: hypothetical protein ABI619_13460, partial [Betaproteobacteria bacterium]